MGIALKRELEVLETVRRFTTVKDGLSEHVAAMKGALDLIEWKARLLSSHSAPDSIDHWLIQAVMQLLQERLSLFNEVLQIPRRRERKI